MGDSDPRPPNKKEKGKKKEKKKLSDGLVGKMLAAEAGLAGLGRLRITAPVSPAGVSPVLDHHTDDCAVVRGPQ